MINAGETLLTTDVLVIGAGGAGLRAAIEAARNDVRVLVASKFGSEDPTCTTRAWGGFTHATEENAEELFRQVVETGGFLNNQRLVEVFVRDVPKRVRELADFGVAMHLWGETAKAPDRLGIAKLDATGQNPGFSMTKPLRAAAESLGVVFLDRVMVTSLLTQQGRIVGAVGVQLSDGNLVLIGSKAVILATGGGACLYPRTDNPPGTTADGIALAYDAGAALVDMECISFNFPSKRLSELFAWKEIPSDAMLAHGNAHYFLGGIEIDERCRTSIPGLYAAGETAGGLFGAARLGGSALADTVVFGAIAGQEAAKWAKGQNAPSVDVALAKADQARIQALLSNKAVTAKGVISKVRALMWRYCGIMKTHDTLRHALDELSRLEADRCQIGVESLGDLREGIECQNMLTVAQLIAAASLLREETRGCFWRLDFPHPNNAKWVRNIHLQKRDGRLVTEIKPAVMTRLTSPTQPRIGAGCFTYLPQNEN